MQVQVDLQFNDLLTIVKNLPPAQLSRLKKEIENEPEEGIKREDFKALLLSGPTFSKKQLNAIDETRKAINRWRTK